MPWALALLLWDLLALLARFREADGDGLFAALDLAALSAPRGAPLVAVHLAFHVLLAAARVFSLLCFLGHGFLLLFDAGIGCGLEQARKVSGVGRKHGGRLRDGLGRFLEILVFLVALRFADPVGHATRRAGKADFRHRLDQFGGAVMRAILVADYDDDPDLSVRRHAALVVGLSQKRVHPFHDAFGDARRLAEPDRRCHDENVGIDDTLTQRRPVVALTLIRSNASLDVVVDGAHDRS